MFSPFVTTTTAQLVADRNDNDDATGGKSAGTRQKEEIAPLALWRQRRKVFPRPKGLSQPRELCLFFPNPAAVWFSGSEAVLFAAGVGLSLGLRLPCVASPWLIGSSVLASLYSAGFLPVRGSHPLKKGGMVLRKWLGTGGYEAPESIGPGHLPPKGGPGGLKDTKSLLLPPGRAPVPAVLGGWGCGGLFAAMRPAAPLPASMPLPDLFPGAFPRTSRAGSTSVRRVTGRPGRRGEGVHSLSTEVYRSYTFFSPSTVMPYCARSKSLCTKSSMYSVMFICRA